MGKSKDATEIIEEALQIMDRCHTGEPSFETDWNYLNRTFVLNNSGYIRAFTHNFKDAKVDLEEALRVSAPHK